MYWKLCLNLCSHKRLRSRRIPVTNFISLFLQLLKLFGNDPTSFRILKRNKVISFSIPKFFDPDHYCGKQKNEFL